MAVTFDNKAINQSSGAAFVVGANSNRLLLVSVVNGTVGTPVTAATYAGAAMTVLHNSSTSDAQTIVFYKFAPATGSNTITITGGVSMNVQLYSYYNVYQSAIVASQITSGTGGTMSANLNTVADNAVLWTTFGSGTCGTASTVSYTNLPNNRAPVSGSDINSVASNASADTGAITPAAVTTTTIDVSVAPTNGWRFVQVSIAPDTYTPTNIKTVNGLAKGSVKTVNGLAIGSVKTINGLA